MKNVSITIFVNPTCLGALLITLKMLEGLDIENNYIFDAKKIQYSEAMVSSWCHVNIPIELYLTFKYSYQKSGGY